MSNFPIFITVTTADSGTPMTVNVAFLKAIVVREGNGGKFYLLCVSGEGEPIPVIESKAEIMQKIRAEYEQSYNIWPPYKSGMEEAAEAMVCRELEKDRPQFPIVPPKKGDAK